MNIGVSSIYRGFANSHQNFLSDLGRKNKKDWLSVSKERTSRRILQKRFDNLSNIAAQQLVPNREIAGVRGVHSPMPPRVVETIPHKGWIVDKACRYGPSQLVTASLM